MKGRKLLVLVGVMLLAITLVAIGCPASPTTMPPTVAEDTTADQDVIMVDQEVVVIDDVAGDLDLNDLENLDKELAELDNLEI